MWFYCNINSNDLIFFFVCFSYIFVGKFSLQLSFFFFYWQWLHHSISSVSHSVVSDSAPSWTVAHQPPLSMEFSRQEYCSGLPSLSPRDLFDPRTEPTSLAMQADFLPSEPSGLYYRRHKIIQGPVHEFSNKNAVTNHLQTLKEGRWSVTDHKVYLLFK